MTHFYKPDGSAYYVTLDAKGNERDVTLRDARKVGAAPGTTDVQDMLPKRFLESWKARRLARAALTLPHNALDTTDHVEAYLDECEAWCREQSKAVMEEGARIHDAIEKSFTTGDWPEGYYPHVDAVREELHRLFPNVKDWVPEKSFYHPLGFGGKVDLHSPSTGIVVDWKTKDGSLDDGKRLAYDQNIQLAAYQVGLGLNGLEEYRAEYDFVEPELHVTCANIFVSRTHPGKVASHVWDAQDIADGWNIFAKALELWKALSHYNPVDYIQPT